LPEFRLPLSELFGDARMVDLARQAARELLAGDDRLARPEHALLRQTLERRFAALEGASPGCG
jgi:hypothetical protein